MIVASSVTVESKGNGEVINITPDVKTCLSKSGVNNGSVTIFISGSTAAITTIEYEPGLISDFGHFWEQLLPANLLYQHNQKWQDGNGHSHLRASLLGPSLVIPVVNGRITLGTWQQVVVIDFDNKPRKREIVVQIFGE